MRPNSPSPNKKDTNIMSPTKALPVYSDFSHMAAKEGNISNIKFAVGLREDNPDDIIARVFPMAKIVPGVIKEKPIRKKSIIFEEKNCLRPDCINRKEKLFELKDENDELKIKLKGVENRIETARNKISLTEKSIIMAEEKNDVMNGQIEEAQTRIYQIEGDVEKSESFNVSLRRQLKVLQEEIEKIKLETLKQNQELQDMNKPDEKKIIFAKRNSKNIDAKLVHEVAILDSSYHTSGDEDMDSD